jgi:hypothetical protein
MLFCLKHRQPQDRIFDNRQIQIRDFYNQALTELINAYSVRSVSNTIPPKIKIGKVHIQLILNHIKNYKIWSLKNSHQAII